LEKRAPTVSSRLANVSAFERGDHLSNEVIAEQVLATAPRARPHDMPR
jgi:hypothetical protein